MANEAAGSNGPANSVPKRKASATPKPGAAEDAAVNKGGVSTSASAPAGGGSERQQAGPGAGAGSGGGGGGGGPTSSWLGHALLWQPSFFVAAVHGGDGGDGSGDGGDVAAAEAEAAAQGLLRLITNGHVAVQDLGHSGSVAELTIHHPAESDDADTIDSDHDHLGEESKGGSDDDGGSIGGLDGGGLGGAPAAAADITSSNGNGSSSIAGVRLNHGNLSPTSIRGLGRHGSTMVGSTFRVKLSDVASTAAQSMPRAQSIEHDGGWEDDDEEEESLYCGMMPPPAKRSTVEVEGGGEGGEVGEGGEGGEGGEDGEGGGTISVDQYVRSQTSTPVLETSSEGAAASAASAASSASADDGFKVSGDEAVVASESSTALRETMMASFKVSGNEAIAATESSASLRDEMVASASSGSFKVSMDEAVVASSGSTRPVLPTFPSFDGKGDGDAGRFGGAAGRAASGAVPISSVLRLGPCGAVLCSPSPAHATHALALSLPYLVPIGAAYTRTAMATAVAAQVEGLIGRLVRLQAASGTINSIWRATAPGGVCRGVVFLPLPAALAKGLGGARGEKEGAGEGGGGAGRGEGDDSLDAVAGESAGLRAGAGATGPAAGAGGVAGWLDPRRGLAWVVAWEDMVDSLDQCDDGNHGSALRAGADGDDEGNKRTWGKGVKRVGVGNP